MIKEQLFERFSPALEVYKQGQKQKRIYNLGMIAYRLNEFLNLMRNKNSFQNSLKRVNISIQDFSTKWAKPHYFKESKAHQLLVLYFLKDLLYILKKRGRESQDYACSSCIQLDKVSICRNIAVLENKIKNAKG